MGGGLWLTVTAMAVAAVGQLGRRRGIKEEGRA